MSAKQKLIDLLNENLTHLTNHCKEINKESLVFLFKYIETFEFKKTKSENKKAIYYSFACSLSTNISKALVLYQNVDIIYKVLNKNDIFDCKLINKNYQILVNGLSICLFLKEKLKKFKSNELINELFEKIDSLKKEIEQSKINDGV